MIYFVYVVYDKMKELFHGYALTTIHFFLHFFLECFFPT